MSAIEASSVRVSTLADGTLRLVVDVEPRFAVDAFRLFGSPGVPMALAALKPATSEPKPETPKGGKIAQWLGMRCHDAHFQAWLYGRFPKQWTEAPGTTEAEWAASVVRAVCAVESRAELDNNPSAAEVFHRLIRIPYTEQA